MFTRRATPPPDPAAAVLDAAPPPPDAPEPERATPFWAKITGNASGTNRYSWEEVNEGDTTAFDSAGMHEQFAGAGTSAADGGCAYEINLRQDVPTGARVKLWPAGDLTYYAFEYNPTDSPLTTKGDIWGYDTADNRIPVGTNGYALTADSAQALGVKWAAVGDVVGPAGATSGADALYDGTTGKLIKQGPTVTAQTTVNGDPQTTVTQYAYPGADPTTTPTRITQFTVDYDGAGTPRLVVSNYPAGTSGTSYTVETWTPTTHTLATTVNSVTQTQTFTESGGTITQALSGGVLALAGVTVTGLTGAPTVAALTGDVSIGSTTFGDVTGLSFAVAASEVWDFEFVLGVEAVASALGLKFQLTGPASPTGVAFTILGNGGAETSTAGETVKAFSTSSGNAYVAYNVTNTAAGAVRIAGRVRNGANAGAVQLQAKTTSGLAPAQKVLAESKVTGWKN